MGTKIEEPQVEAPDAELADDATAIDAADSAAQSAIEVPEAELEDPPEPVELEGRPGIDRPYEIHLPGGKVLKTWNAQFKLAGTELSIDGAFPDEGLRVEGTWSGRVKGVHVDRHPKNGLILLAVVQVDAATLDIVPVPEPNPVLFEGDGPAEHELKTTKLADESIEVACICGEIIGQAADETEALAKWQTHVRVTKLGPGWAFHDLSVMQDAETDRWVVECSRCGKLHDVGREVDARQLAGEHWQQVGSPHQARFTHVEPSDEEPEEWTVECAACGSIGEGGDFPNNLAAEDAITDHEEETAPEGWAREDVAGESLVGPAIDADALRAPGGDGPTSPDVPTDSPAPISSEEA